MPREIEPIDDSRQVLCEKCRKFVTVAQIRYISKGNDSRIAMCSTCLTKANGAAFVNKKKVEDADKPTYFCSRCRYKFKFDPIKKATLRCPYCGKVDRLTEDKFTTAASILKESVEF